MNQKSQLSKNPEIMRMLGFGLSDNKIEKCLELKQNNYTEFPGDLFNNSFHKDRSTMQQHRLHCFETIVSTHSQWISIRKDIQGAHGCPWIAR